VTLAAVLWSTTLYAQESPDVLDEYEPKPVAELLPETEVMKVSLEKLLSTAQESAPAVERAKAQLLQGKARVEGTDVLTKYNPVVSGAVERFPFGEFSYGEAKAGVSQKFTIGGEQVARLESAVQHREVLKQRLERTRWAVHADVHRLYNLALVDLRQLQLNYRLRAFFEELLGVAETRLEAGEATKIDVQLAKVELARAKQEVVQARSALISRLRTLEKRAGLEAEALPVPQGELPETRVDLEVDQIQKVARESYPLVEVFEALVEEAKSEYEYQRKKAWPDPGVGLFFKHKSPDAGPSDSGLVAQLSLPIPIFNANKLGRLVSAKQRTVAKTKLATLREKLGPLIADAVQSVRAAARQIDIYGQQLVPAFEQELELLREGYEVGQFDITDITVAQQRLLRGREQALGAMIDYFDAAAELERLTGEEFWNSNETPSDK
jgi:cobalt-zinc-cadmium efflux system outer membrane protein